MTDDTKKEGITRRDFIRTTASAANAAKHGKLLNQLATDQTVSDAAIPDELNDELFNDLSEEGFRNRCFALSASEGQGLNPVFRLVDAVHNWSEKKDISPERIGEAIKSYIVNSVMPHYKYSKEKFESYSTDPEFTAVAKKAFPDGFPSFEDFMRKDLLEYNFLKKLPSTQQQLFAEHAEQSIREILFKISDKNQAKSFTERILSSAHGDRVICPDRL